VAQTYAVPRTPLC